jgi:hypothetical protein
MAPVDSLILNVALVALAAGCGGNSHVGSQAGAGYSGGGRFGSGGLGGEYGGTTNDSVNVGGAAGGTQSPSGGSSSAATGGTRPALGGSSSIATGGTEASGGSSGATAGGTQASSGGSSAQGCPDSSAYVGNSTWQQRLEVKAGADYCGGWSEARTLEQELAAKAKLHIVAGTYPLPDASGSYAFALPVCFEFPGGTTAPSFAGPGQITLTQSTLAPQVRYTDLIRQPFNTLPSTNWTFQASLSLNSTVGVQPEPLVFDGSGLVAPFGSNSTVQVLQLCASDICARGVADLWFDSCNPETYRLNRSTVTFAGGQVIFDVRIEALPGGISESPMFILASGTLDSVAFEQRDYWSLVYSATHHQFTRSFAVLFESPINGACGLKVTKLDPYNGSQLPQLYTIHCDLSNIAERSVTAAVTQ